MSNAAAVNSLYVRREKKNIYIIFYILYIYIYIWGL
jgi:hypothetical protein